MAIKDYAVVLSKLDPQQIKDVLDDVLDTEEVPQELLAVVLTFNARLMTELRRLKAWPPGGEQ